MSLLGLYLHIPFCSSICNYCNFNRGLFESGLKDRYVDALQAEILATGRGEPADTIFFGGGTPSLLEPEEIGQLIESCRRAFSVASGAEVTLEANPETLDHRTVGTFSRCRCQSPKSGCAVVQGSGAAPPRTDPFRRSGPDGRRGGPSGRLRERQPGSDDVAAAAVARRLERECRGTDRRVARSRVALFAGALSERAVEGRHGPQRLVAGAGRRRGGDVFVEHVETRRGGVPSVRDLECGTGRPAGPPQPQILGGRRVGRIRVRRALDAGRREVEKRRLDDRLCRVESRPDRTWSWNAGPSMRPNDSKKRCLRACVSPSAWILRRRGGGTGLTRGDGSGTASSPFSTPTCYDWTGRACV